MHIHEVKFRGLLLNKCTGKPFQALFHYNIPLTKSTSGAYSHIQKTYHYNMMDTYCNEPRNLRGKERLVLPRTTTQR